MGNKKTPPAETVKVLTVENTVSVEVLAPVLVEKSEAVAAEVIELIEENSSLKADAEVYEATIKELTKNIEEMSDLKKVTSAEVKNTPSHAGKTFSLDGKEYGFNYPKTQLNREAITVDDVVASEDLQRSLIGIKSGMIFEK